MAEVNPAATSDATIKRLVVDELYWDCRLDVSQIKVEVADGVVTLTGHVPTITDRYSAEADARMIRDVVTVVNRLEVSLPMIVPDAELASNVQSILTWSSDVDNSDIEPSAVSGTVTLRGSVPRYWDKLRAHLITRGVAGVVGIIDELVVIPSRKVADREIAHRLMHAIERHLRESVSLIQATVVDGVVTLRGSVPDHAALIAVKLAAELTAGVVDIHDELKIQHPSPSKERRHLS